jgi:hypothetical protein
MYYKVHLLCYFLTPGSFRHQIQMHNVIESGSNADPGPQHWKKAARSLIIMHKKYLKQYLYFFHKYV